ncbi:ABC transporter permease [Alkalilimnicola ehrlichii]|uniref:ABC transporter permease n=1 Tax=Alkalilimnicola ehrlichii TaxID=351052 RepID=UPI00216187BF|nr:ABC transporter permease [Alkalilimnicola ehrlichii]
MRTLNRKLLRDLWGLKGQIAAIALVLAAGVGAFIGLASTLDSLQSTKTRFYAEARFADIFARLNRAPETVAERIATLPGVTAVQTRVVEQARISLAGYSEPITAELVSIPDEGVSRLNEVYVTAGRLPLPGRADEVVLGEAFAAEHGIEPGITLNAILNGREQPLSVVGIGLSPEYIYQVRPGDLFPDFRHFTVIWMNRTPMATAFDMEGAFNSVVLTHAPEVSAREVIERLDLVLAPYGGLGAHDRDLQLSHRFLRDEIEQIENMTGAVPLIFLAVAAFLLNVVVGRLIRNQRDQIAILKAFGYSNLAVGLHYMAMVAVIVVLGGALGIVFGIWLGRGMSQMLGDFLPSLILTTLCGRIRY